MRVVDVELSTPATSDSSSDKSFHALQSSSRISMPACAGPTVGANCRGKVMADVRRVGLDMGPLLRGGYEERVDMDKRLGGLPRFRPLFVSR